ncbi:hypothetical protein AN958_06951 [Leucoagaricus sp. SymC.cos]|nr:hypothetical protein AN958_06951 [Leucoagaricus sp. SymC.cos]
MTILRSIVWPVLLLPRTGNCCLLLPQPPLSYRVIIFYQLSGCSMTRGLKYRDQEMFEKKPHFLGESLNLGSRHRVTHVGTWLHVDLNTANIQFVHKNRDLLTRCPHMIMSSTISFKNASDFSITGGNFGKVGGNITTVEGAQPLGDRSQGHASNTRTTRASSRQTTPSPPSSPRYREAGFSSRTSSTSENGRDETGSDRSMAHHPADQSHQASLSSSSLPPPVSFHTASTSGSRHSRRSSSPRRQRSHLTPFSSMTSSMIPASATLSTREAGSLPRSPQFQATVAASEITAPTVGSRASSSLSHIDPPSIQRPRNPEPFQQTEVPPSSTYMTGSYFAPSTPTSDLTTPEYSLGSSGSSRAPYHHDARTDSPYLDNPGTAAAREETPRHTYTWIHSRPLPLPPIFHLHTAPTSLHASPYGYQHTTNPGRPGVGIPNSQAMPMLAFPPTYAATERDTSLRHVNAAGGR